MPAPEPPGDPSTLFAVAGKRVLVTGGSRGIGNMIARGFLAAGASVLITARKADACRAAAADLEAVAAAGASVEAVPADVSTDDGVAALAEAAGDRLDVLVNNAGLTWGAPLGEYPAAGWRRVLGTNVEGLFGLTQALLPALRAAATPDDPARVINIGSVDGMTVPSTDNFAYSASKAAVHHLTRVLAAHLARDAVTVNAIAPGPFDSKMIAFLLDDPDRRREVAASVPLGRIGRPDDAAGLCIFLSSRAGAYVTGAVIPLDGGLSAR